MTSLASPGTPAPLNRFPFDPRVRTQRGAAATSPSPCVPFLTSWSCSNPAPPRSHRPVENMPRVKSTQAPERSESATPPASIPPEVGSALGARRCGPASWMPRRRSPAPPRPGPAPPRSAVPPETEPESGLGRQAGTRARIPGPRPTRGVPGPDVALPVSVGRLPRAPHSVYPLDHLDPWPQLFPTGPRAYAGDLKSLLDTTRLERPSHPGLATRTSVAQGLGGFSVC